MPEKIKPTETAVKVYHGISEAHDTPEEVAGYLDGWVEQFDELHNEPKTLVLQLAQRIYPLSFAKGMQDDRLFEIAFEILDEVANDFDISVPDFVQMMHLLFSSQIAQDDD